MHASRLHHHLHRLVFGELALQACVRLGQGENVRHEVFQLDFAGAEQCDGLGKLIAVSERPQELDFAPHQTTQIKLHLRL